MCRSWTQWYKQRHGGFRPYDAAEAKEALWSDSFFAPSFSKANSSVKLLSLRWGRAGGARGGWPDAWLPTCSW